MFTGIVEETGSIERIKPAARAIELTVKMRLCARGLKIGDSLAINGCCLTVVKKRKSSGSWLVQFDLLKETWNRTNLRFTRAGSLVNLERSLAADGRLGGHFVTGHIDGTGKISKFERSGQDYVLEVQARRSVMDYVVPKGSIAVDGISLTVASVRGGSFQVWLIPHTLEQTSMKKKKAGDLVNLEGDLLGKYVRKFISSASKS